MTEEKWRWVVEEEHRWREVEEVEEKQRRWRRGRGGGGEAEEGRRGRGGGGEVEGVEGQMRAELELLSLVMSRGQSAMESRT